MTAALITLTLLATACTGSDTDDTNTTSEAVSTTSDSASTTPTSISGGPVLTMDEALGGTQAVQDFAIYLELWSHTEDGVVSLYADIVEAATDVGRPASELQGGFSLTPAPTLQGQVLAASGEPIESLRADFGLLDLNSSSMDHQREELASAISDAGHSELVHVMLPADLGAARAIVEIVTADYQEARTHAGPGDRTVLDLGFVEGVDLSNTITLSYLVGQTLPGDPVVEAAMSPHELFVYRWNRGLVRVLSDGARPHVSSEPSGDSSALRDTSSSRLASTLDEVGHAVALASPLTRLRAAQESTGGSDADDSEEAQPEPETTDGPNPYVTRLIKQLILSEVLGDALNEELTEVQEYLDSLDPDEDGVSSGQTNFSDNEGNMWLWDFRNPRIVKTNLTYDELAPRYQVCHPPQSVATDQGATDGAAPDSGSTSSTDQPSILDCLLDADDIVGVVDIEMLLTQEAISDAFERCAEVAEEMNRRNEAASSTSTGATTVDAEGDGTSNAGDGATSGGSSDDAVGSGSDSGDGGDDDTDGPPPVACPPPPEGDPPPKPTGAIHGDVHVFTTDGNTYTHQAPGEFVAFDNGTATIQIRTEPWESTPWVSVLTAVAMTADGHTVSLHENGEALVDSQVVDIPRGQTITVGNAEILHWEKGWVVLWADGTVARVQLGRRQILIVTPGPGAATGLLGNGDGDPDNDIATREGDQLDPDADETQWESFYETFVDSWRITDDESLFHYDEGQSTDTFQQPGVPIQRTSVDLLSATAFAEAEQVCVAAGLTREAPLEACILDVALTDDAGFAYDAYVVQASTPRPSTRGGSGPLTPSGDGTNTLTFGSTTVAFGAEPPRIDTSAPVPSWTCQAADGVFTATSSFAETAILNWELDIRYISPENTFGRDEALRVFVFLNGEPHAWMQTIAEDFADAVDAVSFEGERLSASGELYVNDPPTPGLGTINPLPPGAELTPFTLSASCG